MLHLKSNHTLAALSAAFLTVAALSASHASTLLALPSGGISYNHAISLGGTDSGTLAGGVGQWSWQDPAVSDAQVPNGGWGHTSHWIAITLTQNAVLEINLARNANVPALPSGFLPSDNLFPSFTLWQNWDTDAAPADFYDPAMQNQPGNYHVYNNSGNVLWAEDLSYLSHHRNTGAETSVTSSFALPAGNYTLVVGGLANAAVGASRQGYAATLSTAPIPEPTAVFLSGIALAGLAFPRRRG